MPNPDGTMTAAERQQALLASTPALTSTPGQFDQPVLPGEYGGSKGLAVQNELFGNLSDAEVQVKQAGDFGLGTNNNAPTAAMLGNAQATGDKYSQQFAGDAAAAHDASVAAAGRGGYSADTSQYGAAIGNAQQDRGMQTGAYGQLINFANQGPGPSAAQAQLAQATNANTSNALAMARSGRGMGGSAAALRQATAQNAVTQQGANAQAAELRANENTAFQAQRLQALAGAGGVAAQTVQGDQGTAASGLAGAQYQTDTALKGTQLNDASAQAWAAQQQAAQQQALGAEVGAQTQQLNVNATALAGRESQWASANQTHGIDTGNATQAGISDANRQQAYVAAGLSAAGGVISATSDERYKTNVQPLSNMGPAPLPQQAPAQDTGALGPSKASQDSAAHAAEGSAIGGTAGSIAGGAVGTAIAGPVGGVALGVAGNAVGKALGKLIGSDIRSKENIIPLGDDRSDDAPPMAVRNPSNPSEWLSPFSSIAESSRTAQRGAGPRAPVDLSRAYFANQGAKSATRDLDKDDPYQALLTLADQHGVAAASDQKDVAKYSAIPAKRFSDAPTAKREIDQSNPYAKAAGAGLSSAGKTLGGRAEQRFAKSDHPILSSGDALLADSARNAPGSMYQYKDPADGPGTYVGPMAQDLAAHPVTRGAVSAEPGTGKLQVNGARLATVNTAQNHSQQNQLDALDAKISKLTSMLSGSSKYADPSSPDTGELDDARKRYPQTAAAY